MLGEQFIKKQFLLEDYISVLGKIYKETTNSSPQKILTNGQLKLSLSIVEYLAEQREHLQSDENNKLPTIYVPSSEWKLLPANDLVFNNTPWMDTQFTTNSNTNSKSNEDNNTNDSIVNNNNNNSNESNNNNNSNENDNNNNNHKEINPATTDGKDENTTNHDSENDHDTHSSNNDNDTPTNTDNSMEESKPEFTMVHPKISNSTAGKIEISSILFYIIHSFYLRSCSSLY